MGESQQPEVYYDGYLPEPLNDPMQDQLQDPLQEFIDDVLLNQSSPNYDTGMQRSKKKSWHTPRNS